MKTFILLLLAYSYASFAETGFYSPSDAKLPEPAKQAAGSVFEIKTAFINDLDNFSDVSVLDISISANKSKLLKQIEAVKDPKERLIFKSFVSLCERKNSLQQCAIPGSLSNATGFITGDGSKLWTNAHAIERMVKTRAVTHEKTLAQVFASKASFPIFIFDNKGNLVFNGLEQELSFIDLPKPTHLSQNSGNFYGIDNDYVSMALPVKLGQPLAVSTQQEKSGEEIYILGYPYCTGCKDPSGQNDLSFADRYPADNAEDCIQKATIGEVISDSEFGSLANVNSHLMAMVNKDQFIATTADSQYGMSGGPILNSEGKVIGINAGSKALNQDGELKVYSRGVKPKELN